MRKFFEYILAIVLFFWILQQSMPFLVFYFLLGLTTAIIAFDTAKKQKTEIYNKIPTTKKALLFLILTVFYIPMIVLLLLEGRK